MRRLVAGVGSVVILASLALLAVAVRRDNELRTRFDSIERGMTRESVIRLMGEPDRVDPCGSLGSWTDRPWAHGSETSCTVLQYDAPLGFTHLIVAVGRDDFVIDTIAYVSP
jgi:hypothetical protein